MGYCSIFFISVIHYFNVTVKNPQRIRSILNPDFFLKQYYERNCVNSLLYLLMIRTILYNSKKVDEVFFFDPVSQ